MPQIFTKDEVRKIINSSSCITHKAMIMLAYGSGLRLSEVIHLKVYDIDSEHMRILIRQGKGDKDRYAILPKSTLEVLRKYWRQFRPKDWLFTSPITKTHYTTKSMQDAFKSALEKSGISKYGSVHTLRHCFATHLYESGVNLLVLKKLMGHVRIDTTAWYTQVADSETFKLESPIDSFTLEWD